MDEGFGNILYIILTIVFIVAGLIKKNKKANPSAPPPVYQDDDTPSFDTIFETIKRQMSDTPDQQSTPVPAPVTKEIKNARSEFLSKAKAPIVPAGSLETFDTLEGQSLETNQDVDSPIYSKSFDLTNMPVDEEASASLAGITEALRNPDEMRRALIYTEILTPRYKTA